LLLHSAAPCCGKRAGTTSCPAVALSSAVCLTCSAMSPGACPHCHHQPADQRGLCITQPSPPDSSSSSSKTTSDSFFGNSSCAGALEVHSTLGQLLATSRSSTAESPSVKALGLPHLAPSPCRLCPKHRTCQQPGRCLTPGCTAMMSCMERQLKIFFNRLIPLAAPLLTASCLMLSGPPQATHSPAPQKPPYTPHSGSTGPSRRRRLSPLAALL
jgi:hypothetical protein